MNWLFLCDSWGAGLEAGTKQESGWLDTLDIPAHLRQAVSGSTAQQWAADFEGRLTKACNTPADAVVVAVLGNDLRHIVADGVIEINELLVAVNALRTVLKRLAETHDRSKICVVSYADPFGGEMLLPAMAVALLETAIEFVCDECGVEILKAREYLSSEHFLPPDIHPVKAGYEVLANALIRIFEESGE